MGRIRASNNSDIWVRSDEGGEAVAEDEDEDVEGGVRGAEGADETWF